MARNKILFGIGAGMASTAVDGVTGLINIYLIRQYMPEAVSGFWMLVVSAGGFLMLAHASSAPAISRLVAQRTEERAECRSEGGARFESVHLVTSLMMWITVAVGILLYLGYLRAVITELGLGQTTAISWFAYALGLVASLGATVRFSLLNGLGEVGWDKITRVMTSCLGLAAAWAALKAGWGLSGLGISFLLQSTAMLVIAELLLRKMGRFESPLRPVGLSRSIECSVGPGKALLIEVSKFAGMALISCIYSQAGIFVLEHQLGTPVVSRYAPLLRVGALLSTVSLLAPQAAYPYIAKAWSRGDYHSHRRFILGGAGLALLGYSSVATALWFAAPTLMPLWLGPGAYLGPGTFALVLLVHGIQVSNSVFATAVIASTGHAFILPAISTLFCVLPLMWFFVSMWGVDGVPLAMLAGSTLPSIWVAYRACRMMFYHDRDFVQTSAAA